MKIIVLKMQTRFSSPAFFWLKSPLAAAAKTKRGWGGGGAQKNATSPFNDTSRKKNISDIICIGREIRCFQYAGFLQHSLNYQKYYF